MKSHVRRSAALIASALLAALLVHASPARAATTYEIQVGQGFFEQGIPGFSARFYPGSVKVHTGDLLHLTGGAGLMPGGAYPQEWFGENMVMLGQDWFFFKADPDDGERALKFNESIFTPGDCGAQDNPCEWSGTETDLKLPQETENFDMWVEITAPPGTTLWAASVPASSEINVNLKVEVVGPTEEASTQEALDARAAALMTKDYEDAAALHSKMNAKRTSHINAAGQKVFDVWVGSTGGPIELFASYPQRIRIPRGARVQFHFQDEIEPHTATFGGPVARELLHFGFMPVCDPDGDEGAGPDMPAQFEDENAPPCADMSQFEIDVDDRIPWETGNHRVSGRTDYENSGLKLPVFPDEQTFNSDPWTVKFTKTSNNKGFKYICLVHGGFMGGRVVVK